MAQCHKCQAILPADARFCAACGMAVVHGAEQADASDDNSDDGDDGDWTRLVDAPATSAEPTPQPASASSDEYEGELVPLRAEDLMGTTSAKSRGTPLLPLAIVALVIAILAGGWFGWSLIAGLNGDGVEVAATGDDTRPADPRPIWQQNYADNFLDGAAVQLVTSSNANVRDYPAVEGTQVLRLLPVDSAVSGRWVTGAEGTMRWLKLDNGGYVREDVVAIAGGEGSPITIPFNRDSDNFGPEVNAMIDRLNSGNGGTQAGGDEMTDKYGPVPPRRWRGLTLRGVALFYEASGIIFADDVATVRRALQGAGLTVGADGNIAMSDKVAAGCSVTATEGAAARYGRSILSCGV